MSFTSYLFIDNVPTDVLKNRTRLGPSWEMSYLTLWGRILSSVGAAILFTTELSLTPVDLRTLFSKHQCDQVENLYREVSDQNE